MTQQMQNLHFSNCTKRCSPASPNAAKRLYRNLSNKFKGSHSSFEEVGHATRSEREQLRGSSLNLQCNDALFEAVEHQDLQAVRLLLSHYSLDELDLNTPNSEGLTPLDIAVMTNNVPVARSLLQAGAVESPHFVSLESRASHLSSLIEEARERVNDLTSQVLREADNPSTEQRKQLTAWEWRYRLYKRMKTGFELARVPDAPSSVRLSVTSSTSLMVTYQQPLSVNSAVVTRYKVEWSSEADFSGQCGETIVEDPDSVSCTIPGLSTGQVYYVRVSAANMKGWGPPQAASPDCTVPSNWKEVDGRAARIRGQVRLLEHLLRRERDRHHPHCVRENCRPQNASRKQSVSRSLKHLFHSSTKFVKTLKRGVHIAAIFYFKDSVLVTTEDQIPIVEVDNVQPSSMMQEFLWFSKLSCAWDEVDWLRQNISVSMSSSTVLQARHRILTAAAQLQAFLGTQNLGKVYYEPLKDRHGNVLLVTVRELNAQSSSPGSRWIPFSKFQSQRKSLSTPEQPTALDVLLITMQDVLTYQKQSEQRLNPGLYLGYLKVSSSVDQIKVLVPSRLPNVLCHVKVRDNSNVSREEWQYLQGTWRDTQPKSPDHSGQQWPLFLSELQAAVRALLRHLNLPLHQAEEFRVFTQEVLELGHNVSMLLLLPPCTLVCTAPGQPTLYTPDSSFLKLPLQMFELVHFCTYQQDFMGLYCRVSALLEISSLVSQQALREAISDEELLSAKQRDHEVSESLQQLDGLWREVRWIMDVLTYARYKHSSGSLPITWLMNSSEEAPRQKNDLLSPHLDHVPSSSPLPEDHQGMTVSGWRPGSDDESGSEVFLPTDSDSGEAPSPREPDLLAASARPFGQWPAHGLSGSAPDILRLREKSEAAESVRGSEPDVRGPDISVRESEPGVRGPDISVRGSEPGVREPDISDLHSASGRRAHFRHSCLQLQRARPPPGLSEGLYTPRPSPPLSPDPHLGEPRGPGTLPGFLINGPQAGGEQPSGSQGPDTLSSVL
ncbi:ankyrin repeat and fibronectin type-III domain-containing protein 1 [Pristis pectinata]|uniref:ankyrin repeat and fibronectin type-III domain-containing protein 1 n=1 Tax=Pristis pectinata TaxID=685728 RepID=UPI00223D3703|nr:ankyrin repeat and fibronectin type-III domain-containing protein 1 [Pristis pectinata]